MKFKLHTITFILLVIGGLNWLVLALFNWDISNVLGGMDSWVSKAVYILVGLSAIYEASTHGRCRDCKPNAGMNSGMNAMKPPM